MNDIIPVFNKNEELKIVDFILYHIDYGCNHYNLPIYILTDSIDHLLIGSNICFGYETMIRIGFSWQFCEFLSVQERCVSKLEAFHNHKVIYKKLKKGLFDNEILDILKKREGICHEF